MFYMCWIVQWCFSNENRNVFIELQAQAISVLAYFNYSGIKQRQLQTVWIKKFLTKKSKNSSFK